MLNQKMNAVISEVCEGLAERNELVHTIALALLTGKNLFVLGKPGQAKSQAIDLFRAHISGAKQFDILMSKGIDQEQLFGRLSTPTRVFRLKFLLSAFFPPPMRFQTSIIRRKNRCGHCMIASTSRFAPSMSKTRQTV